jgi:murein tripeptide amidase MpaA
MPDIQFDRYYRYEDLTRLLLAYEEEYPELVKVHSLGKSYEGRDIWLVTVTNFSTGPAEEKPALWVDGNIHASEVSPSTACLYLLNQLTTQYAQDAEITRALDSRVFYICPRINPDGAELALADQPKIIRSSTRPYPYDEEPLSGLIQEDIDGDGRMLLMRIKDPNGQWKAHPDEPRLLVRRDPIETGGTYYRVLPEGTIKNYDGVTITVPPKKEGLDLNRNFPGEWRTNSDQPGAGPYPTSEPEIRAIVHFITSRPNITGAITFHTYSGVLLRPFGTRSDDSFPAEDLWTFQKIGKKGTEITGYPNVSVYHDFRYHPKEVISGVFDDWLYDHFGVYAWTVEIWSPQRQAGIQDYKFIDWRREHPIEDDFKLLKWSDEVLGGKGYVEWYPFNHPQLGVIELGGWDMLYAWRNPPPQFLEKEVALFPEWVVWHLLISPKLELHSVKTTPLGEGFYEIQMVVQNTGWLPTNVSRRALEKKTVRGVIAEIEVPDSVKLITGQERMELGQLRGWNEGGPTVMPFESSGTTDDRAKVEWVVHAPNGGFIKLKAHHARAGVVRTEVILD